jgi:hypothetical protein
MCLFPLFGVLQNDAPSMTIGQPPLFDLIQGSKAAEAGEVIVQAAISDARGPGGAVEFIH